MQSFVTGSRCYGQPSETSDIDLVVLTTPYEMYQLKKLADAVIEKEDGSDGGPASASLRFGKLNLIVVTDEAAFSAWRLGTHFCRDLMLSGKPVGRDQAIEVFTSLRQMLIPHEVEAIVSPASSD